MSIPVDEFLGEKIAGGRYRISQRLGEGGMGFVYKARDSNLDADVVVKVPRKAMLEDPEFAERFAREVRALVKLSHPNVVKVTDVGMHDDVPFAVMQFLSGGNLDERRRDSTGKLRALAPKSLTEWLPGIAGALDFVHSEGYVHRDVKPANVLFDHQGHAYLSDFGVAKAISAGTTTTEATLTGMGIVLGTPEYMAPEIILGQSFDGRADQYALGTVVYEVLAGRRPFDGPTSTAVLVQQTTQEPPSLDTIVRDVPAQLAAAIIKTLAKVPAQRFSTCSDFAKVAMDALGIPFTPARTRTLPAAHHVAGKVDCPKCQRPLKLSEEIRGKRVKCPSCDTRYRVSEGLDALEPIDGSTPRRGSTQTLKSIDPALVSGLGGNSLGIDDSIPLALPERPGYAPRTVKESSARQTMVEKAPKHAKRKSRSASAFPYLVGGALLAVSGFALATIWPREKRDSGSDASISKASRHAPPSIAKPSVGGGTVNTVAQASTTQAQTVSEFPSPTENSAEPDGMPLTGESTTGVTEAAKEDTRLISESDLREQLTNIEERLQSNSLMGATGILQSLQMNASGSFEREARPLFQQLLLVNPEQVSRTQRDLGIPAGMSDPQIRRIYLDFSKMIELQGLGGPGFPGIPPFAMGGPFPPRMGMPPMIPGGANRSDDGQVLTDVSITDIKANPARFAGKFFEPCGYFQIDSLDLPAVIMHPLARPMTWLYENQKVILASTDDQVPVSNPVQFVFDGSLLSRLEEFLKDEAVDLRKPYRCSLRMKSPGLGAPFLEASGSFYMIIDSVELLLLQKLEWIHEIDLRSRGLPITPIAQVPIIRFTTEDAKLEWVDGNDWERRIGIQAAETLKGRLRDQVQRFLTQNRSPNEQQAQAALAQAGIIWSQRLDPRFEQVLQRNRIDY